MRGKKMNSIWILLPVLLLSIVLMLGINKGKIRKEYIVGENISEKEITEFYYTIASSTNPPEYLRYHILFDKQATIYKEVREGNHWPLTDKDIVFAETVELRPEEKEMFYHLLKGGIVRSRKEEVVTDGSKKPFLYLYWENDRDYYQVFEFEGNREKEFIELSESLFE